MELNTLNPGKAAKGKSRKRIGRGPGSGWGTTAGRGQKGAGARKSAQAGRVAFEDPEAWLQVSLRQGHADR